MFTRFFEVARRHTGHNFNRLSRHPVRASVLSTSFLLGVFFSIRNVTEAEDNENPIPILLHLLDFMEDSSVTAAHHNVAFLPPAGNRVFRGSLEEFMISDTTHVKRVEVCGKRLSPGGYDASYTLRPQELIKFLLLLNEKQGIEELSFTGCTLNPRAATIIGDALRHNTSIQRLEITSNEVGEAGMLALLRELRFNKSLRFLYARSYNVQCYYWSQEELDALITLAKVHPTLEKIELPDNQLQDFSDLRAFVHEYLSPADHSKSYPTITGFQISRSYTVPPICEENKETLEEMSNMNFSRRW